MKRATVIGSGPNGLAAAIVLARAGVATTLLEAQDTLGGGARSANLTLPGFIHDRCSAVHPLALSSPAFSAWPLAEYGLEWIHPPIPLAHPFVNGTAARLERSLEATAAGLGQDGPAYRRATAVLAARWPDLIDDILRPSHWPKHPFLLARFGLQALWPAAQTARRFATPQAQALFAGLAAHAFLPLTAMASSAVGWVLALAGHAVGWPIPRGGSQRIADALAAYFQSLGGTIHVGTSVQSVDELRDADMILADVTPRQLLKLAGHRLGEAFCRQLEKYRYGPAAYKMDWALKGPIPWRATDCARAGTVHIGGTLEEIEAAEEACHRGRLPEKPFILLAQPSLFDPTRAPTGHHTVWAYAHVPHAWRGDLSDPIETRIEALAPGFRARILARHVSPPADLEAHNANLIGGDINGGAQDIAQMFLRPTRRLYRTSAKNLYLCSASTPPGGGVHGLCGYFAARTALADAGVI